MVKKIKSEKSYKSINIIKQDFAKNKSVPKLYLETYDFLNELDVVLDILKSDIQNNVKSIS